MDNNALSYTRWTCKYHIVVAPKYRRKVVYKQIRADIAHILDERRFTIGWNITERIHRPIYEWASNKGIEKGSSLG